jgi:hypothetical protein
LRHPGLHQLPSNIITKFLFGKLKLPLPLISIKTATKKYIICTCIYFLPHSFSSCVTVQSFTMSQKVIILFAVITTFIACASSSSEVQTNLQAEGKH